jgi:hypothetical protein
MKTAIFVDFDNVYTGLKQISLKAANDFASKPLKWLNWLTQEFDRDDVVSSADQRRVLVRRCYLNPQWYQQYRRSFHEAGFEIIDCPPMTSTGKTSTDIHLVLDAIDTLLDPTHFDEFIVFSADADFSPLLRRLRRHDRRTVMFAAGVASKSYKASADYVIEIDEFLKDALGEGEFEDDREMVHAKIDASVSQTAVTQLNPRDFVRKLVLDANDPVPMATIAQLLQNRYPGILDRKWDGAGSFSSFFSRLSINEIMIDPQNNTAFDRARLAVKAITPPEIAQSIKSASDRLLYTDLTPLQLDEAAIILVKRMVAESAGPVLFGLLGSHLRQELPQLQSSWNGSSTLAGYLKRLPLDGLKTSELEDGATFVLFDPRLHNAPGGLVNEPLVAEMLRAADIPPIKAAEFNRVLLQIKDHMGNDQPFEINAVTRKILESLNAEGVRSSTKRVTGVLSALIFGGLDTAKRYTTGIEVIAVAERVITAAWSRETQAPVDVEAERRLKTWIGTSTTRVSMAVG